MLHAGQKHDLRQRLAADGAEFRRKILWLLHTVDRVAGGASQLYNQLSPVRNLLRIGHIQMNASAEI